jgi:PKD repeat protein
VAHLVYLWDFGDGTTSTQTNPSHVFNNAGVYNVCLTINALSVTGAPICTNQVCQTVTIGSCSAAFEYVGGQFANQFVFQDFSFTDLGTVTAWSWDFGDGTTSNEQFPVHDFALGTYTVCQTITTSWGCTSTWCDDITVTGCVADFDFVAGYDQIEGLYYADFTNTSTTTSGTLSYVWDFGDGTTSTQTNPSHVYTNAGVYNVCLTINAFVIGTSIPICTNQVCQTVTIGSCGAAFEYVGGQFANQFVFQDFSFTDLGTVTAWSWDFGDGTTSTEQFPVHDFAVGTYTVCQTITTSWGCTSTWCDDVTVTGCVADFDFVTGYDQIEGLYYADFTNTSTTTSGTLSYVWTFGDGTTSTQTNPSHVYTNAGVYNVCLTINAFVIGTSIPICTNQVCQTVTIGSCSAAFEYVGGQFANQFVFQDFSYTDLGTVTAWSWDFGDGTTSNEQFPVHDFAVGTYTVCQTITTSWGCTSTWCDDITVTGCVADFDFVAGYDPTANTYFANFTNTSTTTSGTLSYVWTFGDGTTSTQTNPSHVFNNAGVYNVCLTINALSVTGAPICTNQVCQTVTIGSCSAAFEYVGGQFANQFVFQDFSFTDLGTVTAWSWDFGDGTTSNEQFPVHDFALGTYTVCQTITTSWGCTSTWCDDITVTGCVADFDFVTGYNPTANTYFVDFTNTSTTTSGTLSYVWDFGDGTTSTQTNPSHVYTNAGIYNVCLTINAFVIGTSIPICTNQSCQTVTVGSCSAAFEYVGGQFANQFVFQDFSFTDLGTVTAWSWDFGDGTTSTEQFPVHDFAVGTYTVCQTITTSWGCTSTWCDDVTVTGCVADFDFVTGYNPTANTYFANFTNTSTTTSGTLSYLWDFGDGTTSTQTNPSHVYTNAGVYNVCLTVNVSVFGIPICTNQVCQTITVASCSSYFTAAFDNGTYYFNNLSSTDFGTVTSWAWDFGDGNTSTEQYPDNPYLPGTYYPCLTITTSWGCTATYCDTIVVNACTANFDYNYNYNFATGGLTATFTSTATSSGVIDSYFWDFGDGGTSSAQNPVHDYTSTTGTYTVCLTITSGDCSNTVCQPITLGDCQADFTYTNTDPNTFNFVDLSWSLGGDIIAWNWTFGDGTTSTEQNPQHVYTGVGSYDVCLTFITAIGCTSTVCQTVSVTDCQASFTYTLTPNDGYEADFISTSTSSGVIDSYFWDFGDGETSTEANPIYFYFPAGVYTACLTITSGGCSNTVCQDITAASCSSYFTAAFDNGIYYFNNLSSTSFGTVTAWSWDFGDGNTSTEQYPDNPYLPGTYYPCLTITTSWGCTATYCDTIVVNACTANFDYNYNYNFATGGLTATFTSTATSSGVIDSYFWDFGDGGTSSAQNPVHDYTSTTGTYTVCLTITSGDCSNTVCQPITLGDCQADFTYTNTDPNTFNFVDLSWSLGGDIIAWNWTFGDGTTSTEQNPQHVYTGVGSYDVCLTFITAIGCTSTVCQTVSVTDCQASFTYTLTPNDGYEADFISTSTSSGVIDSYFWDFGDGETSTEANPIHFYFPAGVYTACLTITSGGCSNTVCQDITAASCSSYFTAAFDNGIYYFNNLSSTDFGTVTSWAWNFGDGNTSTEQYPDNPYLPGTYYPCLTITTSWGCTATYCDTIVVNACTANFDYNYNYNFATGGLTATFTSTATSSGVIDSYFWDFGDGGTSSAQNPVHDYTSTTGTYTVCLTITSGDCSNTVCQPITLGDCQADFTYTNTDPNTFNFVDLSWSLGGDIIAWNWTFGDGTTSTEQNPQHVYTSVGSYDVCLTFITAIGCTSTACQTVSVTDCQASFTYTLTPNDGYEADFISTSTSSGDIDSYFWDFGDGETSTEVNPVHFYSQAGIYTVCLTITSGNCSTISCQDITAASCSSYFTAAFDNGIYYFNNLSSTSFGTVTSWAWDFGDGNTSTEQYPDNTYLPGTYYPCLTITTSWGCTATYCDTIVLNACTANFDYSYNYNFATGGLTATFTSTATSSGVIDSYFWDFGDGGTSSAQNPVHDYVSTTGNYTVCLTITSGNCSDTYCQPITLGDCQADFTYTNTDPSTFNFVDLSWSLGGDIIAWNWTFGDGTTSTEQNPQHVYTGVGSYDVCLTFTTAIGCTSTALPNGNGIVNAYLQCRF